MNILLIGSGGREHALAWKISQSPRCSRLFIAPGNPGTAQHGTNVDVGISDFDQLIALCNKENISMVVVGPEVPLVLGITDAFRKSGLSGIKVIGPDAYAAQLEGSKSFAKKFMQKYGIPTADYIEVTTANLEEGINFLKRQPPPFVLKADGLAAGKGVLIIQDRDEAESELRAMLGGMFGDASSKVVIEQFLAGIEFSVFVLTDGSRYILLPEAKDYKKIGENDTGPNTGGMGAISPVPFVDAALWSRVENQIIRTTIAGIKAEKMDYTGFVFFGLINVGGEPYVIEYNCRLGDPETEAILPRLQSDLVCLMEAAADHRLEGLKADILPLAAATVVMVSGGYPGDYTKGRAIQDIPAESDQLVFHSGTAVVGSQLVTSGGRVLAITSLAKDFRKAAARSTALAQQINFEGKYFRRDIGWDL